MNRYRRRHPEDYDSLYIKHALQHPSSSKCSRCSIADTTETRSVKTQTDVTGSGCGFSATKLWRPHRVQQGKNAASEKTVHGRAAYAKKKKTRSSDVVERLLDCLSVVSFNSITPRAESFITRSHGYSVTSVVRATRQVNGRRQTYPSHQTHTP